MNKLKSGLLVLFIATNLALIANAQSVYEPYYFATFVGEAGSQGSADGPGDMSRLNAPQGLAVKSDRTAYVADTGNNTIRSIAPNGLVTTIAGSATVFGSADGPGEVARFALPHGIAVSGTGIIYVGDSANHTIRRITPAGIVDTFAGVAGSAGSADGVGPAARFFYPIGVAVDGNGNVFVADNGNSTIRKITPAGAVTTLAGLATNPGSSDGTGAGARFSFPSGVATDAGGNVYVADTTNSTVRKVTPGGVVTTIAGAPGISGSTDGLGNSARFNGPRGLAIDASGSVYVADTTNSVIRKISPDGVVSTLAGLVTASGSADGAGSTARFSFPFSVAVENSGDLFVADTNNHTIRVGAAVNGLLSLVISGGAIGQRLLMGAAPPGAAVTISASSSLGSAFDPITTVSANSSGQFQYQETVGSIPKRFYRASLSTGP